MGIQNGVHTSKRKPIYSLNNNESEYKMRRAVMFEKLPSSNKVTKTKLLVWNMFCDIIIILYAPCYLCLWFCHFQQQTSFQELMVQWIYIHCRRSNFNFCLIHQS